MDQCPARDGIPKTVDELFFSGYVIERGPAICLNHGCHERLYWYRTPEGASISVEIDRQGNVNVPPLEVCCESLERQE
jgi:hypothetical protein